MQQLLTPTALLNPRPNFWSEDVPSSTPVTAMSPNMSKKYAINQPEGFQNFIKNVAIIGVSHPTPITFISLISHQGGGQVGKHVFVALLAKNTFNITAIQRPNSISILPKDIKVIKAEYGGDSDDSQLIEALRGLQVLITTMAVTASRDTTLRVSRAAAAAGVSFIQPNWYGHDDANDGLCEDSLLAPTREAIKAEFESFADTACLFLVSRFWYEFSLAGGPDRLGFDFKNRSLVWFDDGNVKINTSTWPQSGRALANALSLKVLPEDEEDTEPTLLQFGNKSIYMSSFLVSQREMFESVKRVTGTVDADWTISHESAKQRWEDGMAEVKKGNFGAFTKMLYARMFFDNGDGDFESRRGTDNELLGLPVEDLDEMTRIAVRMGEKGEVATHH